MASGEGGREEAGLVLNTRHLKEIDVEEEKKFKFALTAKVRLANSSEVGIVIGRAQYVNAQDGYLIRYCAGDNRQTEAWWSEDAILEA